MGIQKIAVALVLAVSLLVGAGWVGHALYQQGLNVPLAEPRIAEATDDEIRELMIAESLAAYPGTCPCPYSSDRAGRQCGGRSAYSRPGGASPLCYTSDISDAAVAAYRASHQR